MDNDSLTFENARILEDMAARGVDLEAPRVVDFEHRFGCRTTARAFAEEAQGSSCRSTVLEPDEPGEAWEVQCKVVIRPSADRITAEESRFARLAERYGGQPDGWGFLSNPDGSPAETYLETE